MSKNTQPNNKIQSWMRSFEKNIWSKLRNKQRKKLCKRFGLTYKKGFTVYDVVKQTQLSTLPLSFAIASMHKVKHWDKKLLQQNPHKEVWMEKISYDKDGWGSKRDHQVPYGIYKNTPLSNAEQLHLEQVLKSSLSLNKKEKIKVLNATKELSLFQLKELDKTFSKEIKQWNLTYLHSAEEVDRLRDKAEKEWSEIVRNLSHHVSGKSNTQLILDKNKNLVPLSIAYNIRKSVKGQQAATNKIATLLYYQQRIFEAHTSKKPLPFSPQDPILLSGATGTGKSFLIETACNTVGLPYIIVDASSLVSEGIRGYTINDILKDILRKTDYNTKEAETSIIVFDEVDKLLAHYDGESILFQLLRLVEGSDISIDKAYNENNEFKEIDTISTKNMLFIFCGSFQHLIEKKRSQSGFIKEVSQSSKPLDILDIEKTRLPKELLGRINDVVILKNLNRDTYREILLESDTSPIKKYNSMLAFNDKQLKIEPEEIEEIIDQAIKSPYGARTLNKLVYHYFETMLFDAPMPDDVLEYYQTKHNYTE